jgi:exopolyphosphatase/guanosine-5'-triphosphate,3'-diphosphate pyrophosphatase
MAGHLDPTGIIDIGSNSVRFVTYAGNARVPAPLFNEKVTPGLGRGIERDGRMDSASINRALASLARFRVLSRDMALARLHTVATAAVRDASNGSDFLSAVREIGLDPRVLSGEEEAELSALGVISGIPEADGIVADLGGGSLELADVREGKVGDRLSLPLGVLRIAEADKRKGLGNSIAAAIKAHDLAGGRGLYLVGGSFRAIARFDLTSTRHPLPIVHQHGLPAERIAAIAAEVAGATSESLRERGHLSANRAEALPAAMALLDALLTVFAPSHVTVSANGLREGLLFASLTERVRNEDPLIAAALEVGQRIGRFGDHGATIDRWISPLFGGEDRELRRLRLAACLIGDFAWTAHPDFRAERAVDLAIHGNWVGIDARGRALLGRALATAFSSGNGLPGGIAGLLEPGDEERAIAWGRAIRLAQRLSGGTEPILLRSSLALGQDGEIVLTLPAGQAILAGEAVERRLTQLGKAFGRDARIVAR